MTKSIKDFTKKHLRSAYDVVRSVHHGAKESKARRLYEEENKVCHAGKVGVDYKLSKLFVEPSVNRLNLIFSSLSHETFSKKDPAELIMLATKFCIEKNFALRIISRNNLPNPRFYHDFIIENNLSIPKSLAFYTDSQDRVSMPTYRLEVTKGDIFFTENELTKLKEFIKK